MLLQSSPFQLTGPVLALEQAAPFFPAPQTEPEVEDIQSESEPKCFTEKRKTTPFPSKVCPGLVPSAPILHKPQPATPATGPSPASAALGGGEGWKTRKCLSVMKESWRQLQSPPEHPQGRGHRWLQQRSISPAQIKVPHELLPVFSLPLPPFHPCPEQPQHGDRVTFLQPPGSVTW